jgi:NAD(P)-dependent dehydrogenase (short-subunit alcohol dehydrogenase family)
MKISQAKAIITGGASGLGLGTAEFLSQAGASVALVDVQAEQGMAAAQRLGDRACFHPCDVTSADSVREAFSAAAAQLGGINLLVSCAGVVTPGKVLGKSGPLPAETYSRVVAINLIGTFLCDQAAAGLMQHNDPDADGQRGVIVQTASIAAFEGQIGQAAYASSKAGVVGLTLPLAREFASLGIRVVTIAPGIFYTPMIAGMPTDVQESLGKQIPFPSRLGRAEEYAMMVQSIFENTMLNGETIRLDGAARLQPR